VTAFRFLHAADLHLGSPFLSLARADADLAGRFALASREAFSSLVSQAIEAGVAFVVIAGDVYDGEWKDASIGLFFARELARLDRAGIPVILLKGNHDADSVVTSTISLPEKVMQFPSRKAGTFRLEALKVALHGQSFAERAAHENLALSYPPAVPGWFNVGVLHTCCGGSTAHAPYAPCTVQDLALRGYDYWALGHVHEHAILSQDPWVVFPGNLQGRSVRECGPRGAVMVEVEDGRVVGVERMLCDRARWAEIEVDLGGVGDEASAFRRVEDALRPVAREAEGRLMAARLRLTGETDLHGAFAADPRRLEDEAQAAAHRVHADIWLEKVKLLTRRPVANPDRLELKSLDFATLLDGLDLDPEVKTRAQEVVRAVASRLPAGIDGDEAPLGEDLEALLAEARERVLGRLGSRA
jgi:DNA repair exonuclease SbcCD nuclease subunit